METVGNQIVITAQEMSYIIDFVKESKLLRNGEVCKVWLVLEMREALQQAHKEEMKLNDDGVSEVRNKLGADTEKANKGIEFKYGKRGSQGVVYH